MSVQSTWFLNFAGLAPGGVFAPPTWVDVNKPPGHTSQANLLGLSQSLRNIYTLSYFFWSPNLIWFTMTVTWYLICPYDLEVVSKGWRLHWFLKRFVANYIFAFAYYFFFYWTLYIKDYSKRKFRPGYFPTAANFAHDLWYWSLGILQWTVYESGMMWLWASGRLPYVSDAELIQSPKHLLFLSFWLLVIPQWRDYHFYMCHRFSHIRAVYKYVHSLHHRNNDPQPFSGICMHPVEHLLYFSNALVPTLYIPSSPLVFMWIFVHLVMAPGAGHSGWEDHWQADQYHWLHHYKFECNYGSPASGWIDKFFGTFREKIGASDHYTGEYKDNYDDSDGKKGAKIWSPQGYLGIQSGDHLLYTCFCAFVTFVLFWAVVVNPQSAVPLKGVGPIHLPTLVAALVAYGPVLFAMLLCVFYDRMSWRWPFHKERVVGAFGFFVVAGWLVCLVPIYHFVELLCS